MSSRHPDRGYRARPLGLAAAGLALAAAGFTARGLWLTGPAHPASASEAAVPVSVAAVTRTTISARQVVPGTLGYRGAYSVLNELPAGIITWLPAPGQVVRRGQRLFALADQPVTLLYGQVPAWRDFLPGMTPGSDVRELQRNLAALGFDPQHQLTADGQFGWATQAAVERWQLALGLAQTGTIPLGEVAFLPGPLRVTSAGTPLGAPAAPGAAVLTGTSDTPSVSVSLTVGGPAVQPGDPVLVTMPDGTTTVPGTVAAAGRVATMPGGTAQGSGGQAQAAIPLTITIGRVPAGLDQAPVQVTITEQQHRGVLAVPVTALLVMPGGGYAVRAAVPPRRLIPVSLGLFDDSTGLVEVAAPRLTAGLTVEVAAG
jgi:peptidoglycan hydrolase-like protein with peptidoglycan-binding domain